MQIGNGEFLKGDCLELMKNIPDGSVDMILCDLPYGTTACKWDSIIPFEPLWEQYLRVAKSNAAIVLTASQPFTSALVSSNYKMFRHEWIWYKNRAANFASSNYSPLKEHESILIFSSSKTTFNIQYQERSELSKKRIGKGAIIRREKSTVNATTELPSKDSFSSELRKPSSLQFFPVDARGTIHPTQKPVSLFEYLIKTYTNEGETVLDNTAGSGTTAIAAINTNRKWICMEMDDTYYTAATERVKNHIPPVNENTDSLFDF